LQQSELDAHDPPTPEHATWLTFVQTPFSQKPEQHWNPFVHWGAASVAGGVFGVAMQAASVQKPRMFGVSA
jgi:hypothetical protein